MHKSLIQYKTDSILVIQRYIPMFVWRSNGDLKILNSIPGISFKFNFALGYLYCTELRSARVVIVDITLDDCSDGLYLQVGFVAHQIGHAIGFLHEDQRPDRDKYVTIKDEFIQDQALTSNEFQIITVIDTLQQPYDYHSIMHRSSLVSLFICLFTRKSVTFDY